jgi:hypothetical protein
MKKLAVGIFAAAALGASVPASAMATENIQVWTGDGPGQQTVIPTPDGVASTVATVTGTVCHASGLENDPDHQASTGPRVCHIYYHVGGGYEHVIGLDDLVTLETSQFAGHGPGAGTVTAVTLKLGAASEPGT